MKLRRVLGDLVHDTDDKPELITGKSEAGSIMDEAMQAYNQWATIPLPEKALFMETLAGEMLTQDSKLIHWMMNEARLSAEDAYAERLLSVRIILRMAGILRDGIENDLFRHPGRGPVMVFGAADCPCTCGLLGLDVVSAITAGCPVIYVVPGQNPGSGEMIAQVLHRATERFNFPFKLIQPIAEDDMAVITPLLEHPFLRGVAARRSATQGPRLRRIIKRRTDTIPFFNTAIRHRLRTDLSMIRRWMR